MKETSRRIVFIPETNGNPYIARMKGLLSRFGTFQEPQGLKAAAKAILTGKFKLYDIVWINFADNEMIGSHNEINIRKTVNLFIRTAAMCLLSNQSIFVRHNHYPHATCEQQSKLARKLVDIYEKLFDNVLSLSGAEVTSSKLYCPHPLLDIAESGDIDTELLASLPTEYYIVFGRIMRYKKLDELIKVFPKNKTLVIAGSVGEKDYLDEISCDLPENIVLIPRRISESTAQAMVQRSQSLVISHAGADMIVSGSFFYAMSLRKRVHAVRTDFFSWIQPQLPKDALFVATSLENLAQAIEHDKETHELLPLKDLKQLFGDDQVIAAIEKVIK